MKYLECINYEENTKYWFGHKCFSVIEVDDDVTDILCHRCTARLAEPPKGYESEDKVKKPRGWQFYKEFVDSEGNVFHKGVEQPKLKGKLEPTVIETTVKVGRKKMSRKEKKSKIEILLVDLGKQKNKLNKLDESSKEYNKTLTKIKRINNNIDKYKD